MKTSASNIIGVIPVFQPNPGLYDLISAIGSVGIQRLVIVDDGSDQAKRSVFERIAAIDGVTVLRHAVNLGKGQALKTAFNHVLLTWPSASGVVSIDGDGQHRPEDVREVAAKLADNPDAMILGARTFAKNTPWRNYLGNNITRWMFRILVGENLADTQTGLRAVPMARLPEFLRLPGSGYEYETLMLIHACGRAKLAVVETPIAAVYSGDGTESHFNGLVDSLKILSVLLRSAKFVRTR